MTKPLVTVSPAQGFHFVISYEIQEDFQTGDHHNNNDGVVELNECDTFVLQTFPADVFVDPFELVTRREEHAFTEFSVWGETDLEKPVSAVGRNGSAVLMGPLLGLTTGRLELPIHARYPLPIDKEQQLAGVTHSLVIIPTPSQLRICNNDWSHSPYAIDTMPSWLEPPFAESHIRSSIPFNTEEDHALEVRIPTGMQAHFEVVHSVTLVTILVAAVYLVYISGALPIRPAQVEKKKKKQA